MTVEVKNTLGFYDFPDGSARPTLGEIAGFVKSLNADAAEMEATYRIADEKAIFIKFKSESSMLYAFTHNPEELIFNYADGQKVKLRMSPAGGKIQYVRVYGLPPEVPDRDLALVLGKYGKVRRVVREKFPVELGLNMLTGVRGAYIDVKTEIPPSLHFLNQKGNIFYDGIKDKCFLCKMEGHRRNSCPKRKSRKQPVQQQQDEEQDEGKQHQDEEQSGSSTYAGVVAENNTEDVHIEVLEEEVMTTDVVTPEAPAETESEVKKPEPPVFKHRNDAYYYYKFGIVDYTEKERIKDEEERMAQEKRKQELKKIREKEKAQVKSPPRKNQKKSSRLPSDNSSE